MVFVFASAGTLVPFTFSARFAYGIWGFVCVFHVSPPITFFRKVNAWHLLSAQAGVAWDTLGGAELVE